MQRRQTALSAQQPKTRTKTANNNESELRNNDAELLANTTTTTTTSTRRSSRIEELDSLATSHHNVRQNSPNARFGDILNVASNNRQNLNVDLNLSVGSNAIANSLNVENSHQKQQRRQFSIEANSSSSSSCSGVGEGKASFVYSRLQFERQAKVVSRVAAAQSQQKQQRQQQFYSSSTQINHVDTNLTANQDYYSNFKPASLIEFNRIESVDCLSPTLSRPSTILSSPLRFSQQNLKHSSSLTTPESVFSPSPFNTIRQQRFYHKQHQQQQQQQLSKTLNDHDELVQMTRTPYGAGSVASASANSYAQNNTDPANATNSNATATSTTTTRPNNFDYSYNDSMMHPTHQPVGGGGGGAGAGASGGGGGGGNAGSGSGANNSSNAAGNASKTIANNSAEQHLSKVHAHSTSLLANDSYMAGMSSDSELTGSTTLGRHHVHSRPYSSQSRVYHAHPAPRSSNSSSRMSHYSDSGAPYALQSTNDSITSGALPPIHNQQQQQQTRPTHQALVSSGGGSGPASVASYMAGYADMPIMEQQARPTSGQQLAHHPARPFKQSLSIDHHSIGQYHHQKASHHLTSPAHPINAQHYESAPIHSAYQSQQQQFGYPNESVFLPSDSQRANTIASGAQMMSPFGHQQIFTGQQQRNFRLEMEMMEKQTSNINLYDNETSRPMAHNPAGLPPHASRISSRQLPHTNPTSISMLGSAGTSVDHVHRHSESFIPPQAHQTDLQAQQKLQNHPQQQHHHQQQQQQEGAYASHQMGASASDWLPSAPSHHLSRPPTQFKQAMSIDHYQITGQQHHYSPVRVANLNEHYRTSLGHATSSPVGGYETPTRTIQPTNSDHHNEIIYQQYLQEQQEQQQISSYPTMGVSHQHQARQAQEMQQLHDSNLHQLQSSVPMSNFSHSSSRASASTSTNAKRRSELQHQFSSSSSNSGQSSSLLCSSNIDISKSLIDQQKANTIGRLQYQQSPKHSSGANQDMQRPHHQQQQQQRQGPLRKGYTSVVSGLGGISGTFSESGNLPPTHITATTSLSGETHMNLQGGKRSALRATSPAGPSEATTSSSGQHHHSSSSKEGTCGGSRSESSTGLPNGANPTSSLTKKSNSATQLSMTGTKKRLGFRKKQLTSFSVHRSEEVAPLDVRHLVKQGSSVSEGDSSMSGDSSSRSWSNSNFKPQASDELASKGFIEGVGKGQLITRQGLACPYLGDIQLSLCDRRGNLEVEIIRARNLQAKANKETLPLTYVKLYLVNKNRKCLAKAKTSLSTKRTLDPLFQQQLTFHEDYHGCTLQSIIWGNFGKMDKKNFMGIAMISIDDLELADTVISWYRLFSSNSLQTLPSKCLRHTLLSNSTESFTNTNNS